MSPVSTDKLFSSDDPHSLQHLYASALPDDFVELPYGDTAYRLPLSNNDIDDALDDGVGYNSFAPESYPVPPPDADEYDLPVINTGNPAHDKLLWDLILEFKRLFSVHLHKSGSSLPEFFLHIKPDAIFHPHPPRRFDHQVAEILRLIPNP